VLTRAIVTASLVVGLAGAALAQETADYFRQNCASCHTVGGGRLSGPDLKGVTNRRTKDWLRRFIRDPKAIVDSGDATAREMVKEARGVVMPTIATLTPEKINALIELLEKESQLETSQFKGLQISTEPFTPADVARGRQLFLGLQTLANGAPACHSCHAVHDLGGLGGGGLGPDLTKAYERLDGRKGLSAWLSAPGTNTMQPLFKNRPLESDEIHALVAYFEDAAQHPEADRATPQVIFLLLGLGGAVALLMGFEFLWRGRYRGTRRGLVQQTKLRGTA